MKDYRQVLPRLRRKLAVSSSAAASCAVPKGGTRQLQVLPWEPLGRAQEPQAALRRLKAPQPISPSLGQAKPAGAGSARSRVKPCIVPDSSDAGVREGTPLSGAGKGGEVEEAMPFQSWKRRVEASLKSSVTQESIAPLPLSTQGVGCCRVPAWVIQGRSASNVGEASSKSWSRIPSLERESPGLLVRLMKRLSSFPLCLI